jgi:hypothetical protein
LTSIPTSCSEGYRKAQIHNNEGVTVAKFPIKIRSDKGQAAKHDVPSSYPSRKEERRVFALANREGAFHKKQYKVEKQLPSPICSTAIRKVPVALIPITDQQIHTAVNTSTNLITTIFRNESSWVHQACKFSRMLMILRKSRICIRFLFKYRYK